MIVINVLSNVVSEIVERPILHTVSFMLCIVHAHIYNWKAGAFLAVAFISLDVLNSLDKLKR